ncbi:LIM/homeobox protein Lhx2 [Clonorchis sinensis]|uniref:LIM/homeobox protein Lhx2 n=1 Tax=Clonorchis sinensis TaxID=79923 RepID=G7Y2N0_CLOSI|nr:LIM/homeobox protein Lhx2 [Clonorchis sinensis]
MIWTRFPFIHPLWPNCPDEPCLRTPLNSVSAAIDLGREECTNDNSVMTTRVSGLNAQPTGDAVIDTSTWSGVPVRPNDRFALPAGNEIKLSEDSVASAGNHPPNPNKCRLMLCTGCGTKIMQSHLLCLSDGELWHTECLRCCECGKSLHAEASCFNRSGSIYCKEDYHTLFGFASRSISCAVCKIPIGPHELIIRSQSSVFHYVCFNCRQCNRALQPGDRYALIDGQPVCHADLLNVMEQQGRLALPGFEQRMNRVHLSTDYQTKRDLSEKCPLPPGYSSSPRPMDEGESPPVDLSHATTLSSIDRLPNCNELVTGSPEMRKYPSSPTTSPTRLQSPCIYDPPGSTPGLICDQKICPENRPDSERGIIPSVGPHTHTPVSLSTPLIYGRFGSDDPHLGYLASLVPFQTPPPPSLHPGTCPLIPIPPASSPTQPLIKICHPPNNNLGTPSPTGLLISSRGPPYNLSFNFPSFLSSPPNSELFKMIDSGDSFNYANPSTASSLLLHHQVQHKRSRKRRTGLHQTFDNVCLNNPPGYCIGMSTRQKRMRTSFKHHQLRAMKAYFNMNHNPDVKDLKVLTEKTGLSKRVLQVWFQNARAKYRRSLLLRPDAVPAGTAQTQANGLTPSAGSLSESSNPTALHPSMSDCESKSSQLDPVETESPSSSTERNLYKLEDGLSLTSDDMDPTKAHSLSELNLLERMKNEQPGVYGLSSCFHSASPPCSRPNSVKPFGLNFVNLTASSDGHFSPMGCKGLVDFCSLNGLHS